MRAISALMLAGLLILQVPANLAAETAVDPAALSLAKSFAKICILAVPDFNNVILAARIEGWTQVEGSSRDKMMEWKAPPTRSAWITKGVDDLPVGVIVGRHSDQTVKSMAATCAVQNPNVAAAGMANALAVILPLPEPEKPIVEGDKTTTVWSLFWGNRTVAVAMVAATSNKPGVILNAVIQQNVR